MAINKSLIGNPFVFLPEPILLTTIDIIFNDNLVHHRQQQQHKQYQRITGRKLAPSIYTAHNLPI